jgi:hypothetical protein
MSTVFTEQWAADVQARLSQGFTEQDREGRLPDYWTWIDTASSTFTGVLALGAVPVKGDDLDAGEFVAIRIVDGAVQEVRVITPDEARASDYLLVGTYESWQKFLGGYDAARTVMYRHLQLHHGNLLGFFNRVYYWIQLLSLLHQVPSEVKVPEVAAA